ncbi:DUF6300 family protein [Streptomyces spororaveus]|uniref:DUF6300 family protein n=1 Tax=Streptomyces spororaveus TaxID=284039 RepID=UPI0027E4B5E1|nr:DUF6300 family protein [Streptomyces spororaveus]
MAGGGVTSAEGEIEIVLADSPPCARCGGSTVLAARFPHRWQNGSGQDVHGIREAVLCGVCDQGPPVVNELLALFAGQEQFGPGGLARLGELLDRWLAQAQQVQADEERLDRERLLWVRGEL